MVDTMTDPRWQRTYGTFGEDPEFIADAAERLVVGFQGSSEGVQTDGIALTIKHFPGGGAREMDLILTISRVSGMYIRQKTAFRDITCLDLRQQ